MTSSIYELDEEGKRIRRLSGYFSSTPRQGEDGIWTNYEDIKFVRGPFDRTDSLLIIWRYEDGIAKTTLTSPIVKIKEQSNVEC